jgi:predicted nucleic acid-binding protein
VAYLLDTNVVSEAIKPQPDERALAWLEAQRGSSGYLSVLTLGEIEQGIIRSRSPRKAERLRQWLEAELRPRFQGRTLVIDAQVMKTWGRITGRALQSGSPVSYPDSLLAATAVTHGLTLVTRNTKDVAALPVEVLNPWEA